MYLLNGDQLVLDYVFVIAQDRSIRGSLINELFRADSGRIRVKKDIIVFRSATEFFTEIEGSTYKGIIPDLFLIEEGTPTQSPSIRQMRFELEDLVRDMRGLLSTLLSRHIMGTPEQEVERKRYNLNKQCDLLAVWEKNNPERTFGLTRLIRGWPLYEGATAIRMATAPILAVIAENYGTLVSELISDGADGIVLTGGMSIMELVARTIHAFERGRARRNFLKGSQKPRKPRILGELSPVIRDRIIDGLGRRPDDPKGIVVRKLANAIGCDRIITLSQVGGLAVPVVAKTGEKMGQLNFGHANLSRLRKSLAQHHPNFSINDTVGALTQTFESGEILAVKPSFVEPAASNQFYSSAAPSKLLVSEAAL